MGLLSDSPLFDFLHYITIKYWLREMRKALYWVGEILYFGGQYIAAINIGMWLSLIFIIVAWR